MWTQQVSIIFSTKLIRECADLISIPSCNIFNNSLGSGLFPDDWKCARVIPLFKQGERTDVNNYRPISVISIIAKLFERIVYHQLYSFLASEEIITDHQSGFRSLHSTVTALLEATDSWAFHIDRGNVNAVIFLDLKKSIWYRWSRCSFRQTYSVRNTGVCLRLV